jgi:hypothetical protein
MLEDTLIKPKKYSFTPNNRYCHCNSLTLPLYRSLKNLKRRGPDASNNLSFPSYLSPLLFTNAALLFQEYKDSIFGMLVVVLYICVTTVSYELQITGIVI